MDTNVPECEGVGGEELVFLGSLMLTWLGFFIWPGLLQLTMGDLRCGYLVPMGVVLIVIGGLMNFPSSYPVGFCVNIYETQRGKGKGEREKAGKGG